MDKVKVFLPNNKYEIIIGDDAIKLSFFLGHPKRSRKTLVLTDRNVAKFHEDKIRSLIISESYYEYIIDSGEEHKNLLNFERILEFMLTKNFDRESIVIALGGGVVGDLGGFVASCYQRGIDIIQIPTTLLAQVDSSVGGKTAVNHPLGKNMIGAFHQPIEVICDVSFLETLPTREFNSGLAEIIKYGIITDVKFFNWLEENIDLLVKKERKALQYAIKCSCENKRDIVIKDEKEKGERALLNFGHTFGHAIENITNYNTWLHGEAVSIGMCMAAKLSNKLGLIDKKTNNRIKNIVSKSGLPTKGNSSFDTVKFIEIMSLDKKNTNGKINLILLESLGSAKKISDVPIEMIANVINT